MFYFQKMKSILTLCHFEHSEKSIQPVGCFIANKIFPYVEMTERHSKFMIPDTLQRFLLLSCLVLTCLWSPQATAQKSSIPPKADKFFQQARLLYLQADTVQALELLEKAIQKHEPYVEAWALKGKIEKELKQWEASRKSYQKIASINPREKWKVLYQFGRIEMDRKDYVKAIAEFDACLLESNIPASTTKNAQKQKDICNFRIQAVANPVDFNPLPLNAFVNSKESEYLPAITADGTRLFFTRRIGDDAYANEDFYFSDNENGEWKEALSLDKPINGEKSQEGALSISPDGKRLFYAANDPLNPGGFDLYYSYEVEGEWLRPVNIGKPINTRHWESQPSISADGKTLYFASNRPGGLGGLDIWKSELIDNKWQAPINLGQSINTEKDEQCPFIHADGQTLYFSSKGHLGMGDADLFMSTLKNDGNWEQAENLGYPINTERNENSLIVNIEGTKAWYSRYVDEEAFNLFTFDLPKSVQPVFTTYVKGLVSDSEEEGKGLEASIAITDVETGEVINTVNSDAQDGSFLLSLPIGKNYAFSVEKEGYLFYSNNFSLAEATASEPYELNILLSPVKVGKAVVLKNIFYETGSYELLSSSFVELNTLLDLLNENESLAIEIVGHTDNQGSEQSNQQLSEERAKSVYAYLMEKGIAANRLKYTGKGESQPIADNETEAGRATNRRTEFIITAQ